MITPSERLVADIKHHSGVSSLSDILGTPGYPRSDMVQEMEEVRVAEVRARVQRTLAYMNRGENEE